jgi:hypothetical protein
MERTATTVSQANESFRLRADAELFHAISGAIGDRGLIFADFLNTAAYRVLAFEGTNQSVRPLSLALAGRGARGIVTALLHGLLILRLRAQLKALRVLRGRRT